MKKLGDYRWDNCEKHGRYASVSGDRHGCPYCKAEKKKKNYDILIKFCKKIAKQKDCPTEFIEIVNNEFWNLLNK